MDPRDAAFATRELLKPRYAVPIYYGTFPVLRGTPQEYRSFLGDAPTQVFPINPGDKVTF
jgi:L-ascorbate metabolism protein UlaG (beta-lactamase superfamily)